MKDRHNELELFEKYLSETRYVGEVGLDAGRQHYASFDLQKEVFTAILTMCAQEGNKLLSIHSVRSASVVLDLLGEHLPITQGRPVLHWFSGSAKEAARAIEFGCYFSVNHAMLSTPRMASIVSSIPAERLLTQTDGPFVNNNNGPCKPGCVVQTLNMLADVFRVTEVEIREQVTNK